MNHEAQKELERLYAEHGALSPQVVVDAAEPVRSPLHKFFTWDDEEAAVAHRLDQARQLIRVAVKVLPNLSNEPVRQFVSLSSLRRTGTGSYLATVDIMNDEQRAAEAYADALKALQSLQKRFRYLPQLEPIWDELAKLTVAAEEAQAA